MSTDPRACRRPGVDPDDWFAWPGSLRANRAKALCLECPLYWECQEYALTEGIPEGIWGGMDGRERERIWKRRGGKPTGFLEGIDEAVRPLLQARRDAERPEGEVA